MVVQPKGAVREMEDGGERDDEAKILRDVMDGRIGLGCWEEELYYCMGRARPK